MSPASVNLRTARVAVSFDTPSAAAIHRADTLAALLQLSDTASSNTPKPAARADAAAGSRPLTDHHDAAGHGRNGKPVGPPLESRRRHPDAPPDPHRRDPVSHVAVEPAPGELVGRRPADLQPARRFGHGKERTDFHHIAHVAPPVTRLHASPSDGPTDGPDAEREKIRSVRRQPASKARSMRPLDVRVAPWPQGSLTPAVGGHRNLPAGGQQTLPVHGHLVTQGAGGWRHDSPARCRPRPTGTSGMGPADCDQAF